MNHRVGGESVDLNGCFIVFLLAQVQGMLYTNPTILVSYVASWDEVW